MPWRRVPTRHIYVWQCDWPWHMHSCMLCGAHVVPSQLVHVAKRLDGKGSCCQGTLFSRCAFALLLSVVQASREAEAVLAACAGLVQCHWQHDVFLNALPQRDTL
jgi:hypothetical protein